jgi:Lrp/AsnC family transcriptional regulator, leucine-responsive regulatory protein
LHCAAKNETIRRLVNRSVKSFVYGARMQASFSNSDLDAIDWRILAELQSDASLSNQALAAKVHVSPATCLRRVRRLTEQGVIERRVALLSPDKLAVTLTAIAEVSLDTQGAEHLAAFEARALAEAAVQQCYRVSPGPDFVLVLQVADMPAWHALVQRLFTQDANVRNVKSFFSVHRAKLDTRIALPAPPGATAAGRKR